MAAVGDHGQRSLAAALRSGKAAINAWQSANGFFSDATYDAFLSIEVSRLEVNTAVLMRLRQNLCDQIAASTSPTLLLSLLEKAFPYILVEVRTYDFFSPIQLYRYCTTGTVMTKPTEFFFSPGVEACS